MTILGGGWPLLLALCLASPPGEFAVLEHAAFRLVVSHRCQTSAKELKQRMTANLRRVTTRLGDSPVESTEASPLPEIRVYGSHEEKGLATGSVEALSRSNDGTTLELVVDEPLTPLDGRVAALLALRKRFGPTESDLLREGAQYFLASPATVREYRRWAAWIATAGEVTPLSDLLDPERFGVRSFRLQAPLAAVVVEVLVASQGIPGLERAWSQGRLEPGDLSGLYRERLAALVDEHRESFAARRAGRAGLRETSDLRGVCFAHEGYNIHDGYISDQAERSLSRARGLGARTISVTPFGYYRDPHTPEVRWRRRTSGRQGYETDESLLVVIHRARELGLATMMRPHLFGHGWRGEIEMRSSADWQTWFQNYGEFLVHHALLAEQAGCEWLCIGSELVQTTKGHAEEWAALALRARSLFTGGITYSANWGGELDSLGFAKELDAIGVDLYAPLSALEEPSDARLRVRAGEILSELAIRQTQLRRPIILTEIGYPSRQAAWSSPHRNDRDRPLSPEAQARCLAAFFEAFRYQTEGGIAGFYLWKWPTLDSWPLDGTGDYWPASEGALEVLKRAFGE